MVTAVYVSWDVVNGMVWDRTCAFAFKDQFPANRFLLASWLLIKDMLYLPVGE